MTGGYRCLFDDLTESTALGPLVLFMCNLYILEICIGKSSGIVFRQGIKAHLKGWWKRGCCGEDGRLKRRPWPSSWPVWGRVKGGLWWGWAGCGAGYWRGPARPSRAGWGWWKRPKHWRGLAPGPLAGWMGMVEEDPQADRSPVRVSELGGWVLAPVLLPPVSDKTPKHWRGPAPGPRAGWIGMVEARTFKQKKMGGWWGPVPGPLLGSFEDVSREACDGGERVAGLGIERTGPRSHHSTEEDLPSVLLRGGWGWWERGRSGEEDGRLKRTGPRSSRFVDMDDASFVSSAAKKYIRPGFWFPACPCFCKVHLNSIEVITIRSYHRCFRLVKVGSDFRVRSQAPLAFFCRNFRAALFSGRLSL